MLEATKIQPLTLNKKVVAKLSQPSISNEKNDFSFFCTTTLITRVTCPTPKTGESVCRCLS